MALVTCQTCGGLKSPTTEHACRVQLHPLVIEHLQSRTEVPVHTQTAEQALALWGLEAAWALDLDAPLDQYLDVTEEPPE